MNDLVEGMEETIKGEELDDSDIDNSIDDPASNSSANAIERQQNLTEQQQQQLQTEIITLEQKPNKTPTEQAELEEKRKRLQELEELLKKQNSNANNTTKPSDKTSLVIGCGVIGVVLIGLVLILMRKNKKKKH